MANRTKVTDRARKEFLAVLSETGNVSQACRAINISRNTLYRWRKNDEEFAEDWAIAETAGLSLLEEEAHRRAVTGIDEPVFYQGEECGTVRKYSDRMLEILLKARDPGSYCTDRLELTGRNRGAIEVDYKSESDALLDEIAALAERLEEDGSPQTH